MVRRRAFALAGPLSGIHGGELLGREASGLGNAPTTNVLRRVHDDHGIEFVLQVFLEQEGNLENGHPRAGGSRLVQQGRAHQIHRGVDDRLEAPEGIRVVEDDGAQSRPVE